VLDDGDGFREALNPSWNPLPDGLFDVPDGQISEGAVQPRLQKYSDFPKTQITSISLTVPSLQEGRCATSRNAGRDAVDADRALDEGA
jgi:hypothetical protein